MTSRAAHLTVARQVPQRRQGRRLRILQRHIVRNSVHYSCLHDVHAHTPYSGWDMHDTVYPKELLISNRQNGYRDLLARIDLSLMRRIPWEDNVPLFLLSFCDPETKEPVSVCPRCVSARCIQQEVDMRW